MNHFGLYQVDLDLVSHARFYEPPPVYPSVYWQERAQKPAIEIYTDGPVRVYHEMTLMLNNQEWSDKKVTSFMAAVITENATIFSKTLTENWRTEECNIANVNTIVSPLTLLTVNRVGALAAVPHVVGGNQEDRLSLFYALLMLYRKTISKGINELYGANLARKMNAYFQSNRMLTKEADITSLTGYISDGNLTPDYKRIICAVDMYFFKYPKEELSGMRMATLPSRYRGCGALTLLDQIARFTRLTPKQLLLFIFTRHLATDVARVTKVGEGAGDIHGYFPYQLEMGIATRSAYSVSVNPHLCLWLHTIGAILGYTRSINAPMPEAVDRARTVESAIAVALNLTEGSDIQKRLIDNAVREANEQDAMDEDTEMEPQARALPE